MSKDSVTTQENIVVNDFDSLKNRIWREINGHRTDLILAALRCVIDEVTWQSQEDRAPAIHKRLMEATNAEQN